MVQDGIILTEEQVAALEKTKEQKEANGEIETQHPGYLGSQDTYYAGNIKRYWTRFINKLLLTPTLEWPLLNFIRENCHHSCRSSQR